MKIIRFLTLIYLCSMIFLTILSKDDKHVKHTKHHHHKKPHTKKKKSKQTDDVVVQINRNPGGVGRTDIKNPGKVAAAVHYSNQKQQQENIDALINAANDNDQDSTDIQS